MEYESIVIPPISFLQPKILAKTVQVQAKRVEPNTLKGTGEKTSAHLALPNSRDAP